MSGPPSVSAAVRPSARMVPWLRSWRAGFTSLDDVAEALKSDDLAGIEQVVTSDDDPANGIRLWDGLSQLSGVSADDIRLVLVVPGDVRGLPTSGDFTAAALTVSEAVVAGAYGLVPYRKRHVSGSGDSWETIEWRWYPIRQAPVVPDEPTVAEADMALSEGLREAVKILGDLDVTTWNRDLSQALGQVRDPQGQQLPPGFDPRARRLYARAILLDRALFVAEHDATGGALNTFEATARVEALRGLSSCCRQALKAVCHDRLSC